MEVRSSLLRVIDAVLELPPIAAAFAFASILSPLSEPLSLDPDMRSNSPSKKFRSDSLAPPFGDGEFVAVSDTLSGIFIYVIIWSSPILAVCAAPLEACAG